MHTTRNEEIDYINKLLIAGDIGPAVHMTLLQALQLKSYRDPLAHAARAVDDKLPKRERLGRVLHLIGLRTPTGNALAERIITETIEQLEEEERHG